ncbi:MAG TPA: hypothetical protein ENJ79_03265 [Gammaproteobacteria bacterium]|nr:hypothetical protein [Gammaproteobacteria bacterium]
MARYLPPLLLLALSGKALAIGDPTRPTDPARYFGQAGQARWVLQSILLSGQRRIAIINGERVRVGDRLRGARVMRIEPRSVVLETARRRLTLQLWPGLLESGPRR